MADKNITANIFGEGVYAGRLVSGNMTDNGFSIVKASQVGGHRMVKTKEDLYELTIPQLSESTIVPKGVEGEIIPEGYVNDAIGQLWYVASEGKHYQLVDWANRKNGNGWKVFKSGGGGGTIVFSGIITTEVTMETTTTTDAPSDIYYYKPLSCFIAKDASGKYYHQWAENDAYGILSQEEYGLLEDGAIVPDWGRTYQNKADDSLWIYNSETSIGRPVRPRVAYGTCSTAANVAEKVISLHSDFADWKLEVGAEFVVKFDITNSATNVTFNVNGTGAKRVWYSLSVVSAIQGMVAAANVPERYMYDGTNYVWISHARDYYKDNTPQSLGFGYGICETAAATAATTATLANYVLVKNGIVAVKFTNSVPANATLNINSKGAKPIFYRGAAIVAGVINAGDVATFIYNGTNYIYLGTDNALSKAGGKINGELVIADDTDDVVEIDAQGITLRDTSDDEQPQTKITHAQVESNKIVKSGGTSDQVLMADGSVAGTITTAWLEANLT